MFNYLIHNLEVCFWEEDINGNRHIDDEPDMLLDFYEDDIFSDYPDDFDYEPAETESSNTEQQSPSWSVDVQYRNGTEQNIVGYDDLADSVQQLYFELLDYFTVEEELPFDENFC